MTPHRGPGNPGRRALVVLALTGVAACSWFGGGPRFSVAPNPDRNVLLVTIDTLRADAVNVYGGRAETPNLNDLAMHGARFDFAHAHAVVTLVSHATILTGRYPYEHGIRDNTGYRLAGSEATVATLLKARGFATAAFVGGFPLDRRFGLTPGFDRYDDRMTKASGGGQPGERERPADAVVASALEWITTQPGKWFVWVHLYDPHEPYEPPEAFRARFPSDPYLGEVSAADAALGPLFARLRALSRPTLVVATGDHGESLGEHGERTHSLFAYESTLHVPLIIGELLPGQPESSTTGRQDSAITGRQIQTPVRHVDLLPTILASAGAPVAGSGASLLDTINNGRGEERASYFEAMSAAVTRGWAPLRGVLVGREKFIDLPIVELYDLANDPKEATNVITARGDRARVMVETLRQFNVAPPARASHETAETVERLRSLGYIGGGAAVVRDKYTDADDPKRLVEIEQLLWKGNEAARANRFEEAAETYRAVIAKRPDTEDAYRKLALIYWRTGRPRVAIETLESALRNGVTQSEVRIKLGQYLAESGQSGKAIELLKETAGTDPDALIALGNAYMVGGRLADANATFRRLIASDPANPLGYENLGMAQLDGKDFKGAEASLRRALALDPSLAGAYTALGVVFASTGRSAEAIDAWKHALTLDPADENAAYNLKRFTK